MAGDGQLFDFSKARGGGDSPDVGTPASQTPRAKRPRSTKQPVKQAASNNIAAGNANDGNLAIAAGSTQPGAATNAGSAADSAPALKSTAPVGGGQPAVSASNSGEQRGTASPAGPMTVALLLARIRGALSAAFPERVSVVGEISNFKLHSSGHMYFRLKDDSAAIDAVMFRGPASKLKFTPADGLEVVADGRVDVYESRGQLQLYVERLTPKGAGALELAFRQLCEKLKAEGLFDPSHKVPLPRFPRAVGIISSPTGAAIRDIRRTLARRWPAARAYLLPVLVQGEGAAAQIARAIAMMDAQAEQFGIDTIIIARGGGSMEDLWAFNEEVVARAIFAARRPIICGVGHEVDVTIADMVADTRAATPTAAAELAVPDAAEVRKNVLTLHGRIARAAAATLQTSRASLGSVLRSAIFRDPTYRLRSEINRLDDLSGRLGVGLREELTAARRRLEPASGRLVAVHPARLMERASSRMQRLIERMRWALGGCSKRAGDELAAMEGSLKAHHPAGLVKMARQKVQSAQRQLEAMSYRSVLRRGFSVTRTGKKVLRSVADVRPGQQIETELADGRIASHVAGPPARQATLPGFDK